MGQITHGFQSREEWTQWFADYNLTISELSDASYDLILRDLPAEAWIGRYQEISRQTRTAFVRNEEMLDRHVRWFTRTPGRWTREVADPLLASLFRYVTRVQDLGCTFEIADSLIAYYGGLDDEVAQMKCHLIRAFSCAFLDPIHMADRVHADCAQAAGIYERRFMALTPEEQSMGLSIYDLEFDRLTNLLKLGRATPEALEEMVRYHTAATRASEYVLATDKGYEFNRILPDFDFYLGFGALCLAPGECTRSQAEAIYEAAERSHLAVCEDGDARPDSCQVRTELTYLMAQRLTGRCDDRVVLGGLKRLMEEFAPTLSTGATYSQNAVEAVEAIQLATENLTHHGELEPELYRQVRELFVRYLSTRPYTTFVDYVCGSRNYCYILTALPYAPRETLMEMLLRLTMLRQVQTAMHSIMVANLAAEFLDALVERRPERLVGQLGIGTAAGVRARRGELRDYIYSGALLHDLGKVLCSSVINAQSHRLGELEFQVLKFHPVTGGEMLEGLPGLSVYRDMALGHQKSFDGVRGYPEAFDNTASPQKIFIDIITVCDSLDAATDHLGRNYAIAKSFDDVFGELKAGRDVRYSGDLVALLEEDPALRERVRHLLEEGRREVYYKVHNRIMAAMPGHPEQKKNHAWLFDLNILHPLD